MGSWGRDNMVSTGLKGLDKVINSLRLGDNVVWQIDSIDDYADFVRPFVKSALEKKRKLVYIRFALHKPLLPDKKEIAIYKLDASSGFESFSTQLNSIITKEGKEVFYVFDCLSDLLSAWSNDLMVGNFFKITCPYLFELDTIAYFSLLRNSHSFKTVARIRDITQLLINVYNYEGNYYVHPLKVWNRYSPTMFLPHLKKQERFVPIGNSVDTARLFSNIIKKGAKSTKRNLDYWDRLFLKAEDLISQGGMAGEKSKMTEHLCRMIIARDEKLLRLAKENLSLEDFLAIKTRMVGTGFIGGKSVGMLISRSILLKEKDLKAEEFFEPHDSFYIGSDVFYTYIVENGWWKSRMEQRTKDGYFKVANILKEQMFSGVFPEEIKEQFKQMIDYFGQSPIIVRSSSLLEDSFGNAFAGKYESIFLVNQGTPDERYTRFTEAVRRIYASTMNEDALAYRLQRGLDQQDEQMALLVQRVSGAYHKDYFFPDAAGVGISYNTFVWKKDLDPEAGMLRIVLGLGTRAVNRVEGDYPRIVALDQPLLRAHAGIEDAQKFSQHDVDLLDIDENKLKTVSLRELLTDKIELKLDLLAVRDYDATEKMRQIGKDEESWIINFDALFSKTNFKEIIQKILKTLEANYGYPVDIEFTVNFDKNDKFKINILQCRTIQARGLGKRVEIPERIEKEKILFESLGYFLGGNFSHLLRRVIYVDPKGYSELPVTGKYDIARAVGELNRQIKDREEFPVILLGPGRWGTTTPSLGVPVSFAEINNISVLAEVSFASANCIPELSFGTHFFQDLIETGIFYVALFVDDKGVFLNTSMINSWPNYLTKLAKAYAKYSSVIKVYDLEKKELRIASDIISQKVVCFTG